MTTPTEDTPYSHPRLGKSKDGINWGWDDTPTPPFEQYGAKLIELVDEFVALDDPQLGIFTDAVIDNFIAKVNAWHEAFSVWNEAINDVVKHLEHKKQELERGE